MAAYDQNENGIVDPSDPLMLLRRTMLVIPGLGPYGPFDRNGYLQFMANYDLSVHVEQTGVNQYELIANSLGDLTTPSNRYAHEFDHDGPDSMAIAPQFPHEASSAPSSDNNSTLPRLITKAELESTWSQFVILSDVLSFDVRVYAEGAPVYELGQIAIAPGDMAYGGPFQGGTRRVPTWDDLEAAVAAGQASYGAFVDLAFAEFKLPDGSVQAPPVGVFPPDFVIAYQPGKFAPDDDDAVNGTWKFVNYDTWSLGYERDGLDQDLDTLVDEGFDGLDNPTTDDGVQVDGVDDYGERETSPPYPMPLRGIEVKIRMIEVSTQQVRQVSVVGDFTDF